MINVIVTVGIQGSGKSTWAKQLCQNDLTYKRLNKDSIRQMFGFQWDKRIEDDVHKIHNQIFEQYLKNGWNVIIDNTGFSSKTLKDLMRIARKYAQKNIHFEIKYFDVTYQTAVDRDSKRENPVGEAVIKDYWNRFILNIGTILPELAKICNEFNYTKFEPANNDISKPKAIIVDMDGTLAHMNGRGAFDYDKCSEDIVDEAVRNICNKFYDDNYYIIVVSGREDVDGQVSKRTHTWLRKNEVSFDEILMRQHKDMRSDNIVKYEIYKKYIEPNYYVEFALDDRNQVTQMWRDIGLKCLQVNEGDF